MTDQSRWRTEDFETLSWHDVHVHGFRFASFTESEGAADLVLDIDYILKWHHEDVGICFAVCPAELTFHKTFGLKLILDYKTSTAGMSPFSIEGLDRKVVEFATGVRSYQWRMVINWPRGGVLEFEAPEFTLQLTGKPVTQAGQYLSPTERAIAS